MIVSSIKEDEKKKIVEVSPIEEICVLANTNSVVDNGIRPGRFDDIIGRGTEKKTLRMMIDSAKKREEVLDHILFYGPPGLGKTTFAMAITSEIGTTLRVTSGPAIERPGDLAAVLTNLNSGDVLFIDEIHRLPRTVEEILYPAMEDRVLDIVMGKGPSAKTIRLNLEPFTLVGATTQIGKISAPMRDRFGLVQRLDYFDDEDLVQILKRACDIWNISIDSESLLSIATRSRGTARVGLRLLKRVRDYVQSSDIESINQDSVTKALDLLGIDELGLEPIDRKILITIYDHFNGGPVGLSTLSASISEDIETLEGVYEPFLMKCGLIKRTSRGRVLTETGITKVMSLKND